MMMRVKKKMMMICLKYLVRKIYQKKNWDFQMMKKMRKLLALRKEKMLLRKYIYIFIFLSFQEPKKKEATGDRFAFMWDD